QAADDVPGLGIEPVEVGEHGVVPLGQVSPTSGVPAGTPGHGFGVHVPLDCREMSDQAAQSEGAGSMRPLALLGRNAGNYAAGASPHVVPVFQELRHRSDFHAKGPRYWWAMTRSGDRIASASDAPSSAWQPPVPPRPRA